MLSKRIIACLDVRDGNLAKSIKFVETNLGNSANVTVAATSIDGSGGTLAYWNYLLVGNNYINEAQP